MFFTSNNVLSSFSRRVRGWSKLGALCVQEWRNDIVKNQMAQVAGGIAPMKFVTQIGERCFQ